MRPVLLWVAGGLGAGPVGGGGIIGCLVGIVVCVSCPMISDAFENDEPVVSVLARPAASRSAICRRKAAVAVSVWRDGIFGCLVGIPVYVSRGVICGGSETGEVLVSALAASRSAFCCGGGALAIPIEDVKINVCVVEVLARESCAALSGGFEASEALVSGLAL